MSCLRLIPVTCLSATLLFKASVLKVFWQTNIYNSLTAGWGATFVFITAWRKSLSRIRSCSYNLGLLSYAGNMHTEAPPMRFLVPLTIHSLPICFAVLKELKGPSSYKSVFASDKWCPISLRTAWVVFLFLKCFSFPLTKVKVNYTFKNRGKVEKANCNIFKVVFNSLEQNNLLTLSSQAIAYVSISLK